jgi:carbon starvation protein
VVALCVYGGFTASCAGLAAAGAARLPELVHEIGTIFLLAAGVIIVNPQLQMPALTQFASGGGPIIPGPLFPFCFVTIACGAISGFHSLISSGTTSKMIDKETDIRPIGYGAMLIEGVVGIMALIAATAMPPGDYFAINVPQAAYSQMTFQGAPVHHVDLETIEAAVGETVEGRTGGAVSLAVGMAMIFSSLPGMKGLLAYWYHFAIMFEALFILTTIDSGTRVGRFLIQEFMGRVHAPFARPDNWIAGSVATLIMVFSWGYFIYTGQINTIWPLFAVGNQLLASVALAVATSILINLGRTKYIWVTLAPLLFLGSNTLYGGYLNITGNYYPLAIGANTARNMEGWILTICTVVMMVLVLIILGAALKNWVSVLNGGPVPATAEHA